MEIDLSGAPVLIGAVLATAVATWIACKIFLQPPAPPPLPTLVQEVDRRLKQDPKFADQVQDLLHPPPPRPNAEPVRLLALLQREGRLLDFFLEDIQAYGNDQIGAAVRDIHASCRKAIQEHLVLEPIIQDNEGANVEVPAGFDPSAIRLTGNVTGKPPFRGTLQHHGWRVREIKLAPLPEGQDPFVVYPAEVELT